MGRHSTDTQAPSTHAPREHDHGTRAHAAHPYGRSSSALLGRPDPAPVTSPLLLDLLADAAPPAVGWAATPRITEAARASRSRTVAPVPHPAARRAAAAAGPTALRFTTAALPTPPRVAAVTLTVPVIAPQRTVPIREDVPVSIRRARTGPLAVCAVAVLGAVSAGAVLLPSHAAAHAETLTGTAATPTPTTTATPAPGHSHHGRDRSGSRRDHRALMRVRGAQQQHPARAVAFHPSMPAHHRTGRGAGEQTAAPTSSPAPSASPSPTPSASTAPSGSSYTPPAGTTSLTAAIAGAGGSAVALGAGTFGFSDFAADNDGVVVPADLSGAGEDRTILEMTPHSSTKASLVPTASGTTNPLMLMQATGSPVLKDFTLQGTAQGHLYNGLRISRTTNALVENVRVNAVPGDDRVNPGETFGIADFRTSHSVYKGVEVDGAGVGASGLAFNNSDSPSVSDSYFHDNPYSAGVTSWQSNDVTLTDVITERNRTGLNFERTSGTVHVIRPTIEGNTNQDLYIGNDQTSATFDIVDPVFSGKLRIRIPATYMGSANKQQRSSIHVIINGVDETSSVVEWI